MRTDKRIATLIYSFIFVFICNTAIGKENGSKIRFGAIAGVSFSDVNVNYSGEKPNNITGFHLGISMNCPVSDNFSIVPELLYSTKGAELNLSYSAPFPGSGTISATWDEKRTLNYIEIPVLARYKLESGLHFDAGVYLGILSSSQYSRVEIISITGQPDQVSSVNFSSTDGLSNTDLGLAFGLGYQLDNGLGFAACYSLGLTNVSDVNDPTGYYSTANVDSFKNMNLRISIQYLFPAK